jgi:hypothetical protein
MSTTNHVIAYSGGIGSWATAKRVIEADGGPDNVTLLFADVKGNNDSEHLGEDEDTYRFIADTAFEFGARLVTLNEGRSIWQVFHDKKWLGNSRLANCSHLLKQAPTKKWLQDNCDPDETIVYVGISWDEIHRLPAIEKAYASFGFTVKAPLCDPPYSDKQALLDECRADGIEPPRAYSLGFPHNNCGGFCVRAGQAQFRLLLQRNRERFIFHEEQEQGLRDYLEKDVAILTEVIDGAPVPLTLRAFRERQDSSPALFELDEFDFGGCGCFTQDESAI